MGDYRRRFKAIWDELNPPPPPAPPPPEPKSPYRPVSTLARGLNPLRFPPAQKPTPRMMRGNECRSWEHDPYDSGPVDWQTGLYRITFRSKPTLETAIIQYEPHVRAGVGVDRFLRLCATALADLPPRPWTDQTMTYSLRI